MPVADRNPRKRTKADPKPSDNSLDELVRRGVLKAREKLIDLSLRNGMLNFRHSETSARHIRIVDERPEFLAEYLASGDSFVIAPLPPVDVIPPDEDTDLFREAFRAAKSSDPEWLQSQDAKRAAGHRRQRRDNAAERALRDRVRTQLGMVAWQPATDAKVWARECGINPSYDLPGSDVPDHERHSDDKLQTLFFPDRLESKLSSIYSTARTLQEDAGISALYCALGFLEWYEAEDVSNPAYAPLVLLPVNMEKEVENGEYVFSITGRDEDEVSNIALQEKLRRHHALELPDYDPERGIAVYLELVGELMKNKKRWRVRRWATIGLFSFARQVMWNDLDPARWPKDSRPEAHDLLIQIFGNTAPIGTDPIAKIHEVDKPDVEARAPSIITDADASQLSAVIDAADGKNLVIQGPPGTGKSQVITNIIANVMAQGKAVLFVSEKMAALKVVKDRLDHMGLGLYCLEVHSAKASKIQVLGSLKERMQTPNPRVNASDVSRAKDSLQELRRRLTEYATLMNGLAGATGLTVHDVLWGDSCRSNIPDAVPAAALEVRFADPLAIDRFKLAELRGIGKALDDQTAAMGSSAEPASQPWRGIGNANLTRFDRVQAVDAVSGWADALARLQKQTNDFSDMCRWTGIHSLADAVHAAELGSALPAPGSDVAERLLPLILEDFMRHTLDHWSALTAEALQLEEKAERICSVAALKPAIDVVAQLVAVARTLSVQDIDISALPDFVAGAKKEAEETDAVAALLGRVFALLPINAAEVPDVKVETMAADCLDLLDRISQNKLKYRSAAMLEDGVPDQIQEAREIAAQADAAFAQTGFSPDQKPGLNESLPDAQELRRCAGTLQHTGIWGRLFGAEWRRAQRLWRDLFPDKPKPQRDNAATRLKAAATWKDKVLALDSRSGAKAAAGRYWSGTATPFDSLSEVAQWMQEVRQATPATIAGAQELRMLLLNGSADELDELSALAREASARNLSSAVRTCTSQSTTLTAHAAYQRNRVKLLDELNATVSALGIKPGKRINTLKDAAVALQRATECRAKRAADADMSGVMQIAGADEAEQARRIKATIQHGAAVGSCQLPPPVLGWLFTQGCATKTAEFKAATRQLAALLNAEKEARASADNILQLRYEDWCGGPLDSTPIQHLQARACEAASAPDELERQAQLLSIEDEARSAGLGELLTSWKRCGRKYQSVVWAVEAVFFRSAAEKLIRENNVLARHTGKTHEQIRNQFRQLDREVLKLNRQFLAASLHGKSVPMGARAPSTRDYTDYQMLQHQTGLQRPRIALRRLFSRAGDAIRALKPCIMMSPMSVAQYLEPGQHSFDLLVVDEASQMRPEDALGAILRCAQAVIVGDPEQLPPSNFFMTVEDQDDEEAEDSPEESILELGRRCWQPMRMLEVHYRSRHQSLIAYSNREFYEDRLLVYPSPVLADPAFGVSCRRIDGAYEAGQGRNQAEARAIVEEAASLMRQRTEHSIGIVAVNQVQSDFIERLMNEVAAADPGVQAYLQKWDGELEHFFVKNLENVQGDERDIILISTVYGRTAEGVFHQNFGPINKIYGHRRLNVLFTRAKRRLTIFTSLNHAEIVAEGKQRGVRVLKEFLEYAERGTFQPGRRTGEEPGSDFERWFLARLKSAGYEAHPQVGVAKFRIDIGIVHPENPGSYLLGVECDGATYHSSKSARDRDRLRQEVLEALNWKIHRVWSTDWYRDPEREFSRLVDQIERLRVETTLYT